MDKTFIIGFGAQKGGTTWLAANLKKAGVKFPWGKEARILHNIAKDTSENISSLRKQSALSALNNHLSEIHYQNKKNIAKALSNPKRSKNLFSIIQKSEKEYRSKLNSVWQSASKSYAVLGEDKYTEQVELYMKQKKLSHAGDITPIYCSIESEQMNEIYNHLIRLNIMPKAIFIARDPIDRIWSSAKMMAKRNPDKFKTPEDTFKFFKKHCSQKNVRVRTAYEKTLSNLKKSSFKENLLVLFYEDLFEKKTWDCILDFLKLETDYEVDFSKVNASPDIRMGLSEEIRREVINAYSDTYMYMKKEFPEVEKLWANSFKLLR